MAKVDITHGLVHRSQYHPAGQVTAFDEHSGLPIVRRQQSATKASVKGDRGASEPHTSEQESEPAKPDELDEDTAREILDHTDGDKDKARQLARTLGYTF